MLQHCFCQLYNFKLQYCLQMDKIIQIDYNNMIHCRVSFLCRVCVIVSLSMVLSETKQHVVSTFFFKVNDSRADIDFVCTFLDMELKVDNYRSWTPVSTEKNGKTNCRFHSHGHEWKWTKNLFASLWFGSFHQKVKGLVCAPARTEPFPAWSVLQTVWVFSIQPATHTDTQTSSVLLLCLKSVTKFSFFVGHI